MDHHGSTASRQLPRALLVNKEASSCSFAQLLQQASAPDDEALLLQTSASLLTHTTTTNVPEPSSSWYNNNNNNNNTESSNSSSMFVSAQQSQPSPWPNITCPILESNHTPNHTLCDTINNNHQACSTKDNDWGLCQTIVPAGGDDYFPREYYYYHSPPPPQLAGATARQTAPDAFVVELELSSSSSSRDNQNNTRNLVDRLVHVLSHPENLTQWCDALPDEAVVLTTHTQGTEGGTRSSMGRDTAKNCPNDDENDVSRPYEAQWITATTTTALRPPAAACWYGVTATVCRTLGFPTYATIQILAEPIRRAVNVSLGPFPGNVTLEYRFQIIMTDKHEENGGKVRLINQVRVQHHDESSWVFFPSCWWLPTAVDYMNQTLSSMARLRCFVERHSTPAAVRVPSPTIEPPASPLSNDLTQPLLLLP
uniref:Uncharacterized protein n=1 Tax=Amphora coffeiformis TaxID=265554 RepID=A0A7S3L240_9STRA